MIINISITIISIPTRRLLTILYFYHNIKWIIYVYISLNYLKLIQYKYNEFY